MAPADDVAAAAAASPLTAKYGTRRDGRSAREMLAARLEEAAEPDPDAPAKPRTRRRPPVRKEHREAADAASGGIDVLGDFLGSRQGKALQRRVVRGVFGMLKRRL